jgi:CubicO group peptidase (beta-lactamase class C family)
VTEATWFDLASLTKPLVVTPLVCLLIRNRSLSLETTLGEVFPELGDAALGRRRVRHFLTHTSGLPSWEPVYARASSPGSKDVVRAMAGFELQEVGRQIVYSCPGFILLGLILERVTSTPLDVLFNRLVIGQLGLSSELGYRPDLGVPIAGGAKDPAAERGLMIDSGLDPQAVPATAPGSPDDGNARFFGGVAGNAGLFGSLQGVLALTRALSVPGDLLDEEEVHLTTRNHTPGLDQARGLGWQLAETPGCSAGPALSPGSFGHTGFTGTSVWVDPVGETIMVLLSNRVHPGHRETDLHPLRRRFHQLVLGST